MITVTANDCSALPARFDAVTVTDASPSVSGETDTAAAPTSAADATPGAEDAAAYRSAPENAAATSTGRGSVPAIRVSAGSVPTARGGEMPRTGCAGRSASAAWVRSTRWPGTPVTAEGTASAGTETPFSSQSPSTTR